MSVYHTDNQRDCVRRQGHAAMSIGDYDHSALPRVLFIWTITQLSLSIPTVSLVVFYAFQPFVLL